MSITDTFPPQHVSSLWDHGYNVRARAQGLSRWSVNTRRVLQSHRGCEGSSSSSSSSSSSCKGSSSSSEISRGTLPNRMLYGF